MNLLDKDNNLPSPLKNPFAIDKIKRLSLTYKKAFLEKYWSWTASLSFVDGDTSGTQKFEVIDTEIPGESHTLILKEIQSFISNL